MKKDKYKDMSNAAWGSQNASGIHNTQRRRERHSVAAVMRLYKGNAVDVIDAVEEDASAETWHKDRSHTGHGWECCEYRWIGRKFQKWMEVRLSRSNTPVAEANRILSKLSSVTWQDTYYLSDLRESEQIPWWFGARRYPAEVEAHWSDNPAYLMVKALCETDLKWMIHVSRSKPFMVKSDKPGAPREGVPGYSVPIEWWTEYFLDRFDWSMHPEMPWHNLVIYNGCWVTKPRYYRYWTFGDDNHGQVIKQEKRFLDEVWKRYTHST